MALPGDVTGGHVQHHNVLHAAYNAEHDGLLSQVEPGQSEHRHAHALLKRWYDEHHPDAPLPDGPDVLVHTLLAEWVSTREVVTFLPVGGRSTRVTCSECGAAGYGPAGRPERARLYPWQVKHVDHGHTTCPDCGKRLSRLRTGTAQKHVRCPNRRQETSRG